MAVLSLGVLGPVQVALDGIPVTVAGHRPKALLALLVAAGGHVVLVDSLVDGLWDGDPPPSALTTLHGYIAGLRRALEPARQARGPARVIVRQGPGYALRTDADAVDAARFTRLADLGARQLADGRTAEALATLDSALALWRGPAYAGFAGADLVVPEVARLDNLRLAATLDRHTAALELGRHAGVIGALDALTRAHPLSERAWELLALALYRDGRQGDALAALRTAREHLADELGVDPGPALRRLEARVLAQDAALDLPATVRLTPTAPAVPGAAPAAQPSAGATAAPPAGHASASSAVPGGAALPAPLTELVGRERELALVADLLASNRLVTLTGPGGVGKTRLALAAAAAASRPAWFADLADAGGRAEVAERVAAALPAAGTPGAPGTGETAGPGGATGPSDLNGLGGPNGPGRLSGLGGLNGVLLLDTCDHVLDDVAPLAAALLGRARGLTLLATSREPLAVPGEVVVDVPPLGTAAASELFLRRAGASACGPDELADIARLCAEYDHLPLAIELAAAHARALSPRQLADAAGQGLPPAVRPPRGTPPRHHSLDVCLAHSTARLDAAERDLLARLADLDGDFDLDDVVALTNNPAVLPVLAALVAKSLVGVDPASTPRRYRLLRTVRRHTLGRHQDTGPGRLRIAC